ncbi:MAG: DNA-binding protein [Pseudomonadales bacterium RIFCSPLOWO2_12_59_9]|nr:MAG: DNA-binding protein [Pseudomonadales bacterium RIFCSPLOWO2_12_59_9]
MEERLREVARYIGAKELAEKTGAKNRRRWQTVATELRTKTRIEDLVELLKAFPEYELYILHGEVDPARGQISPSYSEADLKLVEPKAGSR